MKPRLFLSAVMVVGFSLALVTWSAPDESTGTPAARASFEKGESARKTGNFKAALEEYRKAIALDPDFAAAHEQYIFISKLEAMQDFLKEVSQPGSTSPADKQKRLAAEKRAEEEVNQVQLGLEKQYKQWTEQHPRSAVYPWVLGSLNEYSDPHLAEQYYREALKIDPRFARAYSSLALIDEVRGDKKASREDLRKAVEASPQSPDYLSSLAFAYRNDRPDEFTRLALQVVEKFPESERAPQALYWLAYDAPTPEQKIHYLLMLKQKFPPQKSDWSDNGMGLLFEVYDKTDRKKALALALEMVKALPKDRTWAQRVGYAQAMVDANSLLKNGNANEALALLDNVTVPRYFDRSRLDLLHARVLDAAGNTAKAYADLVQIDAANPSDDIQAAVESYGQKLGKDPHQVDSDLLKLREANAHPATPFSLPGYTGNKPVSLSEFKGRVILLNFWYPQCGPCRGEFPYIQRVLDKFKDKGFAIVAVNVHPPEDDFVLPMLKGYNLGFIPVKGNMDFARSWGVMGCPTNFLIGADGRVWFRPAHPVSNPEAQHTLELEVTALLRQADDAASRPR